MVELVDNSFKPTAEDLLYNRIPAFSTTTFVINGGFESRYDKRGR